MPRFLSRYFGLSKQAKGGSAVLTHTVSAVGTCAYMAPEVLTDGRYSTASDLWALGCSVVEMATGKPPWAELPPEKLEPMPLMFHIGTAKPPDHHPPIPSYLSHELTSLVENMLHIDPKQRQPADVVLSHSYFAKGKSLPSDAETMVAYRVLLAKEGLPDC